MLKIYASRIKKNKAKHLHNNPYDVKKLNKFAFYGKFKSPCSNKDTKQNQLLINKVKKKPLWQGSSTFINIDINCVYFDVAAGEIYLLWATQHVTL